MGGILIRRVIRALRDAAVPVPLPTPIENSHILIACSGGLDSTALAILIAKYGKRLAREVVLLHINHGWRGPESDEDARFVEALARRLGIPCRVETLDPANRPAGSSWEDWGRRERKRLFARHAGPNGLVLTGHQADEASETLLWRLFTGAAGTHGGGILVREENEIRPLLGCFKSELEAFLREEGVSWREDPSNADGRFLRAAFRTRLKPLLDEQFPRWRQQLLGYAQGRAATPGDAGDEIAARDWMAEWFGTGGVRLRRVHWKRLQSWLSGMAEEPRRKAFARSRSLDSMDLAGGWTVHWEAPAGRRRTRIVIERD